MSSSRGRKRIRREESSSSSTTSEWEEEEDKTESSSSEDEKDDDDFEEVEKKPAATKRSPAEKKHTEAKQSVKEINNKEEEEEDDDSDDTDIEDNLPSVARLTSKGGYAQTKKQRLAISAANTGNVPWNKGKNRSVSDKAKISAGVRARNRLVLLEKLKKLGITEAEWYQKKKQIAYARERLRRARKANREQLEEVGKEKVDDEKETLVEDEEKETQDSEDESEKEMDIHADDEEMEAPDSAVVSLFVRDFHWTPHALDSDEPRTYATICPTGGRGGLICCAACTAHYSRYLTGTYKDLEQQKISKVGEEVTEQCGFMQSSTSELKNAVSAARRKPPPPNSEL